MANRQPGRRAGVGFNRRMKRKSGLLRAFTLIELLVVVAIIAILAAILFPIFNAAKQASKKTACLSNARQIGMGLQLYVSDFDDWMPMANYPEESVPPYTQFAFHAGAGVGEVCWADLVLPYTKSTEIFKCPVDDSGNPTNDGQLVQGKPLCYALNYYFYRLPGGISNFALTGGSLSEVITPSSKIFIAETASNSSREIVRPDRYLGFERHQGGGVYIMADTHAKWHKMPQWWKESGPTWGTPESVENLPCPQWFKWIDNDEMW